MGHPGTGRTVVRSALESLEEGEMASTEGGRRLPRWPWRGRGAETPNGCRDDREITAVLVAECEAFVLGTYVEEMERSSRPVPVWAWTNLLAHGRAEDLARAASEAHGARFSARRWRTARALAAREVLDVMRRGVVLADIQADVLVPVELAIAAHRGAWAWTQERWLEVVRRALRESRYSTMI